MNTFKMKQRLICRFIIFNRTNNTKHYNEHILTTKAGLFGFIAPMAMGAIPADKQPAACLDCGSCEQVCPQQIKISDVMEDFVKVLGG